MAYSRLQSVEERKNVRTAVLRIFFSIAALVLLFMYGLPIVGKFTTFVSELGKSGKSIAANDHTPPAPPRFNPFSNFTNQQNFNLSGTTEPGVTVKLTFNGNGIDTLADKDGNFTFDLKLNDGDNTFSAVSADPSGNLSQKTQDYRITLDKKPPSLSINSPSGGSQFFGSNQRQVTIKGSTDQNTQVTANDRIVAVDDSGNFQYTITLNEGENKFTFKATDQAGNTTSKDISLSFTP